MKHDTDEIDPFDGFKPTMARLWALRNQWLEDGSDPEQVEQVVQKLQRKHGLKWPKPKRQQHALSLIERNQPYSHTRRGLGTGGGMRKGQTFKIDKRVREVIAAADKAISSGETMDEVARRLAAVGLLEPDVFKKVVKQAPRLGGMYGIEIQSTELIRPIAQPAIDDLAKFARMTPAVLAMMDDEFIGHIREQYIRTNLSPGEKAVLDALEYRKVHDAHYPPDVKHRKPRSDIGRPRPHYRKRR